MSKGEKVIESFADAHVKQSIFSPNAYYSWPYPISIPVSIVILNLLGSVVEVAV